MTQSAAPQSPEPQFLGFVGCKVTELGDGGSNPALLTCSGTPGESLVILIPPSTLQTDMCPMFSL